MPQTGLPIPKSSQRCPSPRLGAQPSHPAPAADLNLHLEPDPKFRGAVTEGFPLGSSQNETFNRNFSSQRWRSGELCAIPSARALPSLLCSGSGSHPAHVETSGTGSFSGALQGRAFLPGEQGWARSLPPERCTRGHFVLLAPGFYPALAAHSGFRRTTGRFQTSPFQPRVQELLLLLFPRKQGLTLVSFM